MKKLIAAIVIASVGAAFATQSFFVYDYKASIKRLDISAKYVKYDGDKVIAQKFSVKSDTIEGYVTVPACQSCTSDPDDVLTSLALSEYDNPNANPPRSGYVYLTMKGNSKNVKDEEYYILKAPNSINVAVFGADQTMNGDIVGGASKANKAWMALDFPIQQDEFSGTGVLEAKKGISENVALGFFGLTNTGEQAARILVQNTGFGTVKSETTQSFCNGDKSCFTVSSISGTLVGYPKYLGACGKTPMWDLCRVHLAGQGVTPGVISGTWSLKYNKSLTSKFKSEGDKAIVNSFKWDKDATKGYWLIKDDGTKDQFVPVK